MPFEEFPTPEEEKKISNYAEAIEYLKKEGEGGARSELFQNFIEQREDKVESHIQALELAFRLAVLYYMAGFKEYALESLRGIEETEDYITEETGLFARLGEVKKKMETDQVIEIDFFDEL